MNEVTPKTTIKKWDEVNDKLRTIAENSAKRDELNAKMNDRVLKIQNEYKDTLEGLNKDISDTELDVTGFAVIHKEDFTASKTKVFDYGEISIVKGAGQIEPKDGFTADKVIVNIKKIYKKLASTFIKTAESLNKNALKGLKPAEIKKLGLVVKVTETVHLKIKKIETKANKKAA